MLRRAAISLVVATVAAAVAYILTLQDVGCEYIVEGSRGVEGGTRTLVKVCEMTAGGWAVVVSVFAISASVAWPVLRNRGWPPS